jgi:hypothetical protein
MIVYLAGHSVDQKMDKRLYRKAPRLLSYYHIVDGLAKKLWAHIIKKENK